MKMSLMFYKCRGICNPEESPAGAGQQEYPAHKMEIDAGGEDRWSIYLAGDPRPPEGIIEDIEDGVSDDPGDQAFGSPGHYA